MSLSNAEKEKLDNTCGNLRVTKLGTHVKTLEDFVNQDLALKTNAKTVVGAINELRDSMVNKDCEGITIPPPGFFTLFGNDDDGKLYVYYNDEEHPPVFRHIETPGELEGTLYLYIADPEGENHYEMEIGHYIAVRHLDNYYTKAEIDAGYAIKNHAVNASTYGLGTTGVYGHNKLVNNLNQASHQNGLALSAYQGKVLKDAVDAKAVTVEKQSTAESGYFATYIVKQNNSQVGVKINIPMDFLVKDVSAKTCTTANVPVQGYKVGDKYIDWLINVEEGSASDKHLYLLAKDLGSYPVDEVTLTIADNKFAIKDGGVTWVKLAPAVQNTIDNKVDTAGTGLSKDGTTLNHSNSVNAQSTAALKKIAFDAQGHINGVDNVAASDLPNNIPASKITGLGTVATTNSYADLDNKPSTLPPSAHTHSIGDVTNLQSTLDGKESTSNRVNSLSSSSTIQQYPSAKCVYDYIDSIIGDINDYITS